jgi:hypothetical protein
MKTKSLLIASVAALTASTAAFGAVSSNIVGYTKLTLNDGFNLVANTLNASNNSAEALFASTPAGTQIYRWAAGTFKVLNNLDGAGTWTGNDFALNPGEAVFIKIPKGGATSVYLVGEVVTKPAAISLTSTKGSFNFVSSVLPVAGALDTDLQYTPNDGDKVFTWNNATGKYSVASYAGGWLTADTKAPSVAIGQGLVIQTLTAGASWTQTFTVGN